MMFHGFLLGDSDHHEITYVEVHIFAHTLRYGYLVTFHDSCWKIHLPSSLLHIEWPNAWLEANQIALLAVVLLTPDWIMIAEEKEGHLSYLLMYFLISLFSLR